MMRDLPLKKLRNFGGKLGAELAAMGCVTAGQISALPHGQLTARFGEERAAGIARAVRGYSDEPVQVSLLHGMARCYIASFHEQRPRHLRGMAWSWALGLANFDEDIPQKSGRV